MSDYLIVDGYNIIGAWPELKALKDTSLEEARIRLIEMLADYQGYAGTKVIVVFDAHQVYGHGGKYQSFQLDVYYTKEKETADECIERLVSELTKGRVRPPRIHVATSDLVEQHVIFGKGALRLPAMELLQVINESNQEISKRIRHETKTGRVPLSGNLTEDLQDKFEKWRRGKEMS